MHKKIFVKRLLLAFFALSFVIAVTAPMALAAEETAAAAEGEQTNPLTPLGINGGLLIVHTFNFLLVAALLTVLLWRPAVNMLDARAAKIQKGLEDAAAAARARQNAEADAAKVLADARAEANKILEEARNRAEDVAKNIQAEARSAADKIKADAQAEITTARNAELAGLRDRVVDISVAMAGRILGEKIDAKKQAELVSNFFSNVPTAAKNLGGKVEVISAMPLNDAEQKKAKDAIGAADVTFVVDPSILGGVVIRSADKVIDGSVKSGLGELAGRLG
jgi:F-type H+-transporting ATPase subunit b